MRPGYFQTIARRPPAAAIRLQPRPGLLQRWEAPPAPAWAAAARPETPEPPRAQPDAASPAQLRSQPAVSPQPSAPVQSRSAAGRADSGGFQIPREPAAEDTAPETAIAPNLPEPPLPANRPPAGRPTVSPSEARVTFDAPPAGQPRHPAQPETAVATEAATGAAALEAAAEAAAAALFSRRSARRETAPGETAVRPPRPAIEPARPPQPNQPAGLHIGTIEVHVVPPAPPAPAPRSRAVETPAKAPLARGYASPYGWGQS